jgi:hypothetical protein
VLRQPGETALGNVGYMGDEPTAEEVPLMTGWPASVLATGRSVTGEVKLAGDVQMPWYDVLLPVFGNLAIGDSGGGEIGDSSGDTLTDSSEVLLTQADILVDQTGRRFRVSSVELTPLGWRLHAIVTMT